jgi:hypothetical protein
MVNGHIESWWISPVFSRVVNPDLLLFVILTSFSNLSKTGLIIPNYSTEFGMMKISAIIVISQWTFRISYRHRSAPFLK